MPQTHVMIDIETMGTSMRAAIVAIAAVEFAPGSPPSLVNPFYYNVKLQSCLDARLDVDGDTIEWWLRQSDAARAALDTPTHPAQPITDVLRQLRTWLPDNCLIWSNGAAFDLPILRSAYDACKIVLPWTRKQERCFRTLRGMAEQLGAEAPPDLGTKHNALDDAIWQGHFASRILYRFNAFTIPQAPKAP